MTTYQRRDIRLEPLKRNSEDCYRLEGRADFPAAAQLAKDPTRLWLWCFARRDDGSPPHVRTSSSPLFQVGCGHSIFCPLGSDLRHAISRHLSTPDYLPSRLAKATMRPLIYCAFASLSSIACSQLAVPALHRSPPFDAQHPMMDPVGPVVPPGDAKPPPSDQGGTSPGSVMLSDVMGRDRSINILAGFVRDVDSVAKRLDDSSQNTTVLAPLNSAIEKLPRKPWEDPREYGALGTDAYEGEDGQERAERNLRRFVEAHILPVSPWAEKQKTRALGSDRDVWWEERDGTKVVSSTVSPPCPSHAPPEGTADPFRRSNPTISR